MDKKTKLLSKKVARIRGWIQAIATLLTNIHISNLLKGKIYQGKIKTVCVPGLNCYSCPAATGSCPIGAFQAVIGSSRFKFSYYITGFFILLGVTLGRFICGFLCPFGWFQDLLHKIPGKKFSTARLKPLRYLKYIILIVFVILLPLFVTNSIGMGDPFFCKYICPQGVLEGAIPLSLGNTAIRSALGTLFSFKCLILITVVVLSILFYRPFCNGSVLLERSIHYLIRSAFLILKLKAANVSDAINVQRHVKWILMCARLRIIQNVYDAGLASRFVQKMRSNISFWEKHAPKKNSSNQP